MGKDLVNVTKAKVNASAIQEEADKRRQWLVELDIWTDEELFISSHIGLLTELLICMVRTLLQQRISVFSHSLSHWKG